MAPYSHHINTHHRARRARKFRKLTKAVLALLLLIIFGVGVDWFMTNIRSSRTVVSSESNATVQSARINIFQSPYFHFQANSSWREVTDELNLKDIGGTTQYLYRSFDNDFIEHELWVTVNLPDGFKIASHYIPTRVVPVRIESDGSLTQIGSVSKPCVDVLPKENPNLESHVVKQNDIEYFCNPNEVNDYHVAVGIPGGTIKLSNNSVDNQKAVITVTYRNVTAIPNPNEIEDILQTFKLL